MVCSFSLSSLDNLLYRTGKQIYPPYLSIYILQWDQPVLIITKLLQYQINMSINIKKGKPNFTTIKLQSIAQKPEAKLIRDPYKLIKRKFNNSKSLYISVSTPRRASAPKSFQQFMEWQQNNGPQSPKRKTKKQYSFCLSSNLPQKPIHEKTSSEFDKVHYVSTQIKELGKKSFHCRIKTDNSLGAEFPYLKQEATREKNSLNGGGQMKKTMEKAIQSLQVKKLEIKTENKQSLNQINFSCRPWSRKYSIQFNNQQAMDEK